MAGLRARPSPHLLAIGLSAILLCLVAAAAKPPRGILVSQRPAPKLRQQKLSHFHFFFHDIVSGRNPTAVKIIRELSNNRSASDFGLVAMIDDPLTEGPEVNSKLVGRAQGLYASAAQTEEALLMATNLVFLEGKYNGSTVTILGRNSVSLEVREMPVVGGSGLFRFASGYCHARTHTYNIKTGDAVVEYNLRPSLPIKNHTKSFEGTPVTSLINVRVGVQRVEGAQCWWESL